MYKEFELTEIEIKVEKVISDADIAFNRYSYAGNEDTKRYCKENLRCEFLKVHLKLSLETIEHMKRMEKVNNEFYTKALQLKANEG